MFYKDRFTRIRAETIEATRRLIAVKPWRGNPGRGGPDEFRRALFACRTWLREVSQIYRIEAPRLVVHPEVPGHGFYILPSHTILMPKFSVTTLAHEFRHALQHKKRIPVKDPEEDARGWSVSLIYRADPRFYERAVRKGLLLFW